MPPSIVSSTATPQYVVWTNTVNCTISANVLQKTSGCNGCADAGASSKQQISSPDGYLEFKASNITGIRNIGYVGLAQNPAGTGYTNIDFAINLSSVAEVREKNVYKADTSFSTNTVFRIAIEAGVVKYYKNGVLFYTSLAKPSFPLTADTSLISLNGKISNTIIASASTIPPADTTPPTISATTASNLTTSGTSITWTTNEPADTQVEYGPTVAYGNASTYNSSLVTSHSASLTGLLSGSLYHYRVKSKDAAGNLSMSGDLTFTTSQAPDSGPVTSTLPEAPRVYLDTSYQPPTGQTLVVSAGGDLQAALNSAQPGDLITLQAGAIYTGNFILPAKAGSGWITIRSSAPDSALPASGTRLTPSFAPQLPKLLSPNGAAVLATAPGAHHYRLLGLEVALAPGVNYGNGLVLFGDGSSAQHSLDLVPHDLILDRCYLHGTPTAELRRGVALNSSASAVIDSYIAEIHQSGSDAQAICGWNGPGPFKLVNNYLEASGENVMFGGADPAIANLTPSDIEFRRNYCYKPVSWKVGEASYGGLHWAVKNLFELKNAQRVQIEGNVFENNWGDAQVGFAILFKSVNQDGTAPWSVTQDVSFTNNVVKRTGSAMNILGRDGAATLQQVQRVLVRNNVFEEVDGVKWNGSGIFLQLSDGVQVVVDHNTVLQSGMILSLYDRVNEGMRFTNNIVAHNEYGVKGAGTGVGTASLTQYCPGALFAGNAVVALPTGMTGAEYPANNYFPLSFSSVGFVDLAGGNYHLLASSDYKARGTDGKDIGCD